MAEMTIIDYLAALTETPNDNTVLLQYALGIEFDSDFLSPPPVSPQLEFGIDLLGFFLGGPPKTKDDLANDGTTTRGAAGHGTVNIIGKGLSWDYNIFTGHATVGGNVSEMIFKVGGKVIMTWHFGHPLNLHQFQADLHNPSAFDTLMSARPIVFHGSPGSDTWVGTGLHAKETLIADGGNNTLIGGSGNDKIIGGPGHDLLDGGTGHNTLTGGPGADRFVFDTAVGPGNLDIMTDFKHGQDKIVLSKTIFGNLTVDATTFFAGPGATFAHKPTERIIYDKTTGGLYFDPNGNSGPSTEFALLLHHPQVTINDFALIA
jgi:Ca2+-binding RTX toxin-like protein